jgi:hypothetical protein
MHTLEMSLLEKKSGQQFIAITSKSKTTHSKNIYEMIDSFMKTKPIFQPPHFRDFMNLNDAMYSPPLQETEFVATSGEAFPMCEANLDAKLMYMMFNVNGKLIYNLATPTTIGPYNLITPIVPNSLITPTILLSQNASGHR